MLQQALRALVAGKDLSRTEAEQLMECLMRGEATDAQIGGLLVALRIKGESPQEVAGFASAMRSHSIPVFTKRAPLIDTCGTGGSSFRTFNVSTAAAFVAAVAGVAVAKHGNRAASGVCGSADVLEALGVNVAASAAKCAECIDTLGIGFLFARSHHPAVKHVTSARSQLGIRTVFNLLGPLTNPAGAARQVMGVYDIGLCTLAIEALKALGSERAMVIHAEPGMDELSTFSRNRICELRDGDITDATIEPEDLCRLARPANPAWLAPADTLNANAAMLRQALGEGAETDEALARRDIVALNSAAAIRVAGIEESWPRATEIAQEIIMSGAALSLVDRLAALSQE